MQCPNCNTEFKNVQISSANPGMVVKVDQCPGCGGIWFDQYELYQVPLKEAKKIDPIDNGRLQEAVSLKSSLFCPNDGSLLSGINEPGLPNLVNLKRCGECGGIWLNKGELVGFKESISQKSKALDRESDKWVRSQFPSSNFSNIASSVAGFMMSPVDPLTGRIDSSDEDINSYTLTNAQTELLRKLPAKEKMNAYKGFVSANKSDYNSNKRFAENLGFGLVAIIKIILKLTMRL